MRAKELNAAAGPGPPHGLPVAVKELEPRRFKLGPEAYPAFIPRPAPFEAVHPGLRIGRDQHLRSMLIPLSPALEPSGNGGRSGWGKLRSVAAKGSPEEPVHHLIEQEGVDLVASADEFVTDPHEVFDDRRDFFERETDPTFVSQPRARSAGLWFRS